MANNLSAVNMFVFDDEVENGIDILQKIENNELTKSNYADSLDRGETIDLFGWCKGAKIKRDKTFQYWDSYRTSNCGTGSFCYKGDDKLVYQKAIFYFSIQAKRKSQKECCWDATWNHFPQRHFCDLNLEGDIKYIKRCRNTEVVITVNDHVDHDHKITWRPYSSSRGLVKYLCNVKFYARHTPNTPGGLLPYIPSKTYSIMYGY